LRRSLLPESAAVVGAQTGLKLARKSQSALAIVAPSTGGNQAQNGKDRQQLAR
jgi:hypothetical protein